MTLTASEAKTLKSVRKRVQETHWIKGSMGRVKNRAGHIVRFRRMPPIKGGMEKDFFFLPDETHEYKTCGCLVGLLRWQIGGVRDTAPSSQEYKNVMRLVANHLVESQRITRSTAAAYSDDVDGHENLVIRWNDSSRTNREKVVQFLTEIIGDQASD